MGFDLEAIELAGDIGSVSIKAWIAPLVMGFVEEITIDPLSSYNIKKNKTRI